MRVGRSWAWLGEGVVGLVVRTRLSEISMDLQGEEADCGVRVRVGYADGADRRCAAWGQKCRANARGKGGATT